MSAVSFRHPSSKKEVLILLKDEQILRVANNCIDVYVG